MLELEKLQVRVKFKKGSSFVFGQIPLKLPLSSPPLLLVSYPF
jgi:hypothetical protein